jgi:hypothetical protein
MRTVPIALCVGLLLPAATAAADPGLTRRGALSAGLALGGNDHVEDGGMMGGFQFDLGLRLGWLVAGGSAGHDSYGDAGGAPISSTTLAARIGVAPPLLRVDMPDHTVELFAVGAVELGQHTYDPGGESKELLGPTVTTSGPSKAVGFVGARGGLGLAFTPVKGGDPGTVFRLEVVGRRDRDTVSLPYQRTRCGGLFHDGCDSDSGVAEAGGEELAGLLTAGITLGN